MVEVTDTASFQVLKLGVSITGHTSRNKQVEQLVRAIMNQGFPAQIAWDQGLGEWETHQRAWQLGANREDHGYTHWLVLEDDAVLSRDLMPAIETALHHIPDRPISLYFGQHENIYSRASRHRRAKVAAIRADEQDVSWIETPGTWWGVAIVLPVPWIGPFLQWAENRTPAYDERLSRWLRMQGKGWVLNTWPSLVDHSDEGSLIRPQRKQGRKAFKFIGTETSALDWNPNGGTTIA